MAHSTYSQRTSDSWALQIFTAVLSGTKAAPHVCENMVRQGCLILGQSPIQWHLPNRKKVECALRVLGPMLLVLVMTEHQL